MIWNEEKECMSRDQMADLQGKQLVKLVPQCRVLQKKNEKTGA